MKVLLIYPKTEKQAPVDPRPPLGLAYIASSLELDGHDVMIEDMYSMRTTMDQLTSNAKKFNPDIVGISAITPYITSANEIAKQIKEHFDVPIIVGGPHPSSLPENTLRDYPSFDIAVRGEGEETMRELVNSLEGESKLSHVKGITYREGKIVSNPDRSLIENIDDIPFPAWHLLKMDSYFRLTARVLTDKNGFSIITSRGCPGRCKFCDSHVVWTRRYRARSPTNVVDEIEQLYDKYDVGFMMFWDDTFIVDKRRAIEICNQIIGRGIDIKWECLGRVNLVNKEVLAKMKEAGCNTIYYGIESGSQEVLDYINKGITLEQAKNAIKITKKAGIRTSAYFMIGFPSETEEDIRKTIEFNKRLPLDEHDTFSILTPFPGTELHKIMKDEGLLLNEDWDMYYNRRADEVLPPIRTRHLSSEELLRLKKEGDQEVIELNRTNSLRYFLLRPHKLIIRFMRDPASVMDGATWLIKTKFAKLVR